MALDLHSGRGLPVTGMGLSAGTAFRLFSSPWEEVCPWWAGSRAAVGRSGVRRPDPRAYRAGHRCRPGVASVAEVRPPGLCRALPRAKKSIVYLQSLLPPVFSEDLSCTQRFRAPVGLTTAASSANDSAMLVASIQCPPVCFPPPRPPWLHRQPYHRRCEFLSSISSIISARGTRTSPFRQGGPPRSGAERAWGQAGLVRAPRTTLDGWFAKWCGLSGTAPRRRAACRGVANQASSSRGTVAAGSEMSQP